jgi:hypothetical protein
MAMGRWLLFYGFSWILALGVFGLVEFHRLGQVRPLGRWINRVGLVCVIWLVLPVSPLIAAGWLWAGMRRRPRPGIRLLRRWANPMNLPSERRRDGPR